LGREYLIVSWKEFLKRRKYWIVILTLIGIVIFFLMPLISFIIFSKWYCFSNLQCIPLYGVFMGCWPDYGNIIGVCQPWLE